MIEIRKISSTQIVGVSLYVVFYNGVCRSVYARDEKEAIESIEEERKAYLAELAIRNGK